MRGNPIHNLALIAPIERAARAIGATVYREYHVITPSVDGYVDLLVIHQSRRIVFEAERTLDRIRWDIIKAAELKAGQLHMIFPTGRMARQAQKLADGAKTIGKVGELAIFCLPLGAALQRLTNENPFEVGLYVSTTSIQQNSQLNPRVHSTTSHERSPDPCKSAGTTSLP